MRNPTANTNCTERDDGQQLGEASDVTWVRMLWADSAGVRRCRVVPRSRFDTVFEGHGVGVTKACMAMQAWADVPAFHSGLGAIGEVRLVPDMATMQRLPWHPQHSIVLADMLERPRRLGPAPDIGPEYWECCPRNALRRVLASARELYGIHFRLGFESEFVLSRGYSALPSAVDSSLYCQSSAFDESAPVLDKMTSALHELGIAVEQLHAESAGGQFEIATAHNPALQAVDNLLLTREAIACVAARRCLRACFLPKLAPDQAGSGAHCHISLLNVETLGPLQADTNLVAHVPASGRAEKGPGVIAACFAAGVLRHLPALLAWTLPSAASYARLQPGCWSGAFRVWGVENREAPLRLCTSASSAAQNWEFKALDATANPHLALAAVIAAGCDGIQNGWQLPEPCNVDPANLPGSERLPQSLAEAIHAFDHPQEGSPDLRTVLVDALGAPLVDAFMAVRRSEEAHFRDCTPEQLVRELHARY